PLARTTERLAVAVSGATSGSAQSAMPGTLAMAMPVPVALTTPRVSAAADEPPSNGVPVAATKRTVTLAFGGRLVPVRVAAAIATGPIASTVVAAARVAVGAL